MHPQTCQRRLTARDACDSVPPACGTGALIGQGGAVAEVQIQDGIIKVIELDVQDPRAAAVLAEYPEARWPEVTRRAIKIGLGYLKGGAQS